MRSCPDTDIDPQEQCTATVEDFADHKDIIVFHVFCVSSS